MKNEHICPVCGKYTFAEECDYDICKFCGWENNGCSESGGANRLSLKDYLTRYEMYLAAYPEYVWKNNFFPKLTEKDKCLYYHKFSAANRDHISKIDKCGCFFCLKIFDRNLVSDYLADSTALCPYCSVDAVLPDSKIELSDILLENMYKVWFE